MTDQNEAHRPSLPGDSAALEPPRMPAAARRLVLLGCAGVLLGVLVGRFLFGGLILAAAGIVAIAVALSYRADRPWFWSLSWFICLTGICWTAITAAYGWLISNANPAASSSTVSTSYLFHTGTVALVLMTGGVLTAAVLRAAARRRGKARP